MEKKELELYVHIPFCVKKCAYCDFLSAPANVQERTLYIDALTKEIGERKEYYKDYRVNTVFFGGGTPSVLDENEITRIFDALYEDFEIADDAEITVEVNPGTVTEEKAAAWKKCGVNRLSIGLQSVNDKELQMLGRIHTYRDFLNTWDIVRSAGFSNVNIDLISAVPGQTFQSWCRTLSTAAELGPEHISAYSLIIEEGTPFYERYGAESERGTGKENGTPRSACGGQPFFPPLPDEDTERAIYKATDEILREYGFHRYEISNYARPGHECRHNLGYWERKEYLGLGLGASSLIGTCRFSNTADIKEYIEALQDADPGEEYGTDRGVRGERDSLSPEDQMEEFMFLGLRKMAGISIDGFRRSFGRDIFDVYKTQLEKLEDQGLLKVSGERICLTERGIDVSNYVFSEFIFG